MTISTYLCRVVGENPKRAAQFHISTIRRTTTFAIAIHIPVLLWALTGFVIATEIFHLRFMNAVASAALCSGLIYLVERIVLATPKTWFVNVSRLAIALVISVLGASTVDLVIFDREIAEQLQRDGEAKLIAEFDAQIQATSKTLDQKKDEWFKAQDAANCEANGSCGSKVRSVGPIYRELARQSELLHQDYQKTQDSLAELNDRKNKALAKWRNEPPSGDKAGLLARVQALHTYTISNTAALFAWSLFFVLVLFFEMVVVLSKLVFGETIDDELDQMRERISQQKAQDYMDSMISPLAPARALLAKSY
jgi:Domain of unknown function (DUF4407)